MRHKKTYISILLVVVVFSLHAQRDKLHLNEGNEQYKKGDYASAEENYLESLEEDPNYLEGNFNLGDSYFRQEKYEEAARQFNMIANNANDSETKAKAYHNLGNSLLQSQKINEGINAYKQALRYNPNDEDTRYNLAAAQRLLKQQQQQQKQNQQNQDQQKKDQQKQQQEQDQQDQQDKDQQKQEQQQQQQKDQQQQDKQKQQQQQGEKQDAEKKKAQQGEMKKGEMSKEDAKRLLRALQVQERNTQEKLKKQRLKKGQEIEIEKDW